MNRNNNPYRVGNLVRYKLWSAEHDTMSNYRTGVARILATHRTNDFKKRYLFLVWPDELCTVELATNMEEVTL